MTIALEAGALLDCEVVGVTPLYGGDLSSVHRLELADGRTLVAKQSPNAGIEAAMLGAIRATGAPAPAVLAARDELFVMEWVDANDSLATAWDDLAAVLHKLHHVAPDDRRGSKVLYGWPVDYAFGPVAIPGGMHRDWPSFWAQNRLLCHIPHVPTDIAARLERLCAAMADYLPQEPRPALLHGDLWGGNVMVRGACVAGLIDPACCYGDPVVDLAMLTLFDHPPPHFFTTLRLEAGWRERLPIYSLWPLLVHLRLFGEGYRRAVENALARSGY